MWLLRLLFWDLEMIFPSTEPPQMGDRVAARSDSFSMNRRFPGDGDRYKRTMEKNAAIGYNAAASSVLLLLFPNQERSKSRWNAGPRASSSMSLAALSFLGTPRQRYNNNCCCASRKERDGFHLLDVVVCTEINTTEGIFSDIKWRDPFEHSQRTLARLLANVLVFR